MKRSYTYLKGLLSLALAAFTGWMWAATTYTPMPSYTINSTTNVVIESPVEMPTPAVSEFTVTIMWKDGNQRSNISQVELVDPETDTQVAVDTHEGFSGGQKQNHVYTLSNIPATYAGKVLLVKSTVRCDGAGSSTCDIVLSNGVKHYVLAHSFGVNFTKDGSNVATDAALGYTTEGYAAPATWVNVAADTAGYADISGSGATYALTWTANGGWNSGNDKATDAKNLLYGYLDDVASGGRRKASVTITNLPANREYAVAVILSGDGADGKDAFNNVYTPVLINGQAYSYDGTTLLTGEDAMAATTWGDRRATASADGTLAIGTNVMFVEGLSGSELTITSALNNALISRLTIAGVQVWVTDKVVAPAATAPALPTGAEVISVNFHSQDRSVDGTAGLYAVNGWNNTTGANPTASALNVADGTSVITQPISLTVSSNNVYQWDSATDAFLKGYLDDGGNQVSITLDSIPFSKYAVIVYAATDTANYRFKSVQINGKNYIGTPYLTSVGYATEVEAASAIWGKTQQKTAAYGVNALRVDGLTASTLTIKGGNNSNSARGGIAALQIINMGESVMSDTQKITGNAEQKVSELELTKSVVDLTLPEGATLIVDEIKAGHILNIISTGNVTIKVTDLSISQAQLDAMLNTDGVTGTVTNNFSETIGYTKDGVTYPLVYLGGTDGWSTAANWATGTRTNGETTQWIAYTGTVVPGAPDSNVWNLGLIDGDLIGDAITADEDGYKVVNTPTLEGWNLDVVVANSVHMKISGLKKFQSGCEIYVDDTSKITVTDKVNPGDSSNANTYYIDAEDGLEFVNMSMPAGTAYLGVNGSIKVGTFDTSDGPQTIGGVTLDLGDNTLTGREVVTRTLYTYTAAPEFTINDGAVTTTYEDVEASAAVSLRNVGDYKFVKTDTAYQVQYVAYAEEDKIGDATTWTNTTEDGLWATEGNWTWGVPEAGDDVTITVATETTITIPAEGVTVGVLTVNGAGTLTIAGGKITAAQVIADGNIIADSATLALAPTKIAAGVTVAYTANGDGNSEAILPALTGEGSFSKFGPERLTLESANACEPQVIVNAGTLRFKDQTYAAAYDLVAKDGATIQVGTWAGSLTSLDNVLTLEGGAKLWLYNGNSATGAIIKGTILIDATAEKPAVIQGNSFGNNGNIAAAIKGNGVLEIQDNDDNYFTISGVIADGDAEGDVLAVKVSTDRGVTFTGANTYTGGTVVATGATLTAPMRSGTPMEINGTLVVSYNASQVKLHENDADYSQITGTGKIRISNTANTNGWVSLPEDNKIFASTLALELEANHGLILTDADGAYTFGTLSGSKGFRVDWQNGERSVKILQAANSEHTGALIADYTAARLSKIVIAGATGATEKTLTLSGDTSVPARPMEIDATGSVNLTGAWGGDIDAYGKIAGTGTIGGKLKLQDGANLDVSAGALAVTGEVWVVNAATNTATVTLPDGYEVGMTIISCANAADVATDLSAKMPEGYRCVAENGAVKLAVAKVNVTIPAAPANTKWFMGETEVSGTVEVDPNTDVTLTLKADEGYVFADGTTEKEVIVNSGAEGAEITAPDVTAATPVAKVGETKYQTLAAAIAAGSEVTVIADIVTDGPITINKTVKINLGGKTITATNDTVGDGVFYVTTGGNLTLTDDGEGTVNALGPNGYCMAVWADGGKVTIEGGTYTNVGAFSEEDGAHFDLIYVKNGGSATITGGTFICETPRWTLNSHNTLKGTISITGGKFYGLNPADIDTDDGVTTWCADGYTAVAGEGEDEGYYVVTQAPADAQAKIGGLYYTTLDAALDAAAEGATITLLADVEASEIITIEEAITLDGNGKTLTSTAGRAINVDCAGAVTIKDLTIKASGARAINIINQAATVTINGVTATASNNAVMIATTAGAVKLTVNDCDFTGLAVVNVAGDGAQVTITDSTITNVDATDKENFGAITVWSSLNAAATMTASVSVTDTNIIVAEDSKKAIVYPINTTITGVDQIGYIVAMEGEGGWETINPEAVTEIEETMTLIRDAEVAGVVTIPAGKVLDLNGYTSKGTILGTISVNGGTYVTAENVPVIGTNARAFETTDAVFTMDAVAGNITLNEGAVTAKAWDNGNNWTVPGQALVVKSGVTLNVPAEVTMQVNGTSITIENGATLNIVGKINLYSADATIKAAEVLTVTTTVAGCEVKYVEGKYIVVKSIVVPPAIAEDENIPAETKEAIKEAMEDAGVAAIKSYTITTKGTPNAAAEVADVADVLAVFEVTPTVEANGVLTVAYEFGISAMTNNGDTITITAGVTGAEYRAGVEVAFYADGEVIGTATTTADSTEVAITANAGTINGKKITVKAATK